MGAPKAQPFAFSEPEFWQSEGLGVVPPDPMDPRFWGNVEAHTAAGEFVNASRGLQLDVVQSVLARLSGTVSTLPLMVYERLDGPDADGNDRRPARDHALYRLLRRPNARQTAQEFRAELAFHLCYWRNAYAEIVPDGDDPIGSLEIIHPSRIINIRRKDDGRVYYDVRSLDQTQHQVTLRDDELVHIRCSPLTSDGLRGQYMWETARETFGKALAVETFGSRFFRNGTAGGGILEHPGNFRDKESKADFLETWREGGSGHNQHKDRLLLYGVKYTRNPLQNNEAQFIETLKEQAVKLCRLWNFPPHMAGILDKATFSNIEQQSIEYVVHCIAPWLSAFEQGFSRDLLIGVDQDRYFLEYNVAGLLRGDFKTRYAGYTQARQWGWLSVNDVRRLENMKSIGPAGDVYLVPMNMTPAGQPGADAGVTADPDQPGDDEVEEGSGDDD